MDDCEIIAEFVIESREHLADIENQLLAIEAAGAAADPELVNTVFRAVHSIKGAAGFLGFSTVGQLAHDLENVLNLVRNRRLVPDSAATDVLLRSADKLRTMIEDIDQSNGVDVSEHIEALQAIVAGLLADEAAGPSAPRPAVSRTIVAAPEPQVAPQREDVPVEASPGVAAAGAPTAHGESSIRVAVSVLDRLMNLAGELVLARNQLMQTASGGDRAAWNAVSGRIDQVVSELQETIMQTRLQPVGTVFGRFPRVIRDLGAALAKQCQLTIEGQEVELDKSIIEAIGDPLTHLVRNAVDHGIEPPEARVKAGKPPAGTVALRAFHQAGKVSIQISDDGRGIDAPRLKEKAVAKGIVTAEQAAAMSEREALQLIFRPGFSLAEKVTAVSGRGVGMDVVKTNIERLGGTVSIDTRLGAGTTIDVKLPLTLAIVPALIVRCSGQRYAVPQANIRELVRVRAADAAKRIERVQRAEVFRLREALLPLVRLDAALNLRAEGERTAERAVNIIVVETGRLRYGLVVDGLCDSEEIVVKPLGRHMKECVCLAAATILGDGKVALILDIAGVAAHSRLTIPENDGGGEAAAGDASVDTQSLLLFGNHPSEHFGVPMELVARIERVPAERIECVGGQQVLQYRGGTLPLVSLEQGIACKPRRETAAVYVVVFVAADREVGLIVSELHDIQDVPARFDTVTFREPGVAGSLVHDRQTVRLLDLHELVRKMHPDWYDAISVPKTPEGAAPRILVAEDSDFFRKQLTGFLLSEGYAVEAAEDGAAAWNILRDPENRFDLVVTDIEMPNMTGLELAQRIRDDARLAHLPVIAVTSLAGEDDIRRGRQVGVSDYQIKLDREQLMASVARLLKASVH